MAKSNNQKMKILYLLDLFQNPESAGVVYSMQDIVAFLAEREVSAERKSIYDDLEVLRSFGLDIRFRKERPSGYYLAGEKEIKTLTAFDGARVREAEKPLEEEKNQDPAGYRISFDQGEVKEIKLSCSSFGKEEVLRTFGEDCACKQKEDGRYQILISTAAGKAFYGWLLANENDVRIQKPKKEAAAFRDYLKEIAKGYKS